MWPAQAEERDSKHPNQRQPSCLKNCKPTKTIQGCCHIKIALQDYSGSLFLLNSQSKRNISKMKKQRNNSQLKEQENSPEGANSKTDLFCLLQTVFKKEIMKILKELRKAVSRNADYYKKELGTIRRSQEKLENSFAESKDRQF